jgi:hypothetical protein
MRATERSITYEDMVIQQKDNRRARRGDAWLLIGVLPPVLALLVAALMLIPYEWIFGQQAFRRHLGVSDLWSLVVTYPVSLWWTIRKTRRWRRGED